MLGILDMDMEEKSIPYDLENKTEKHFQTIIYLIFSLLGYYTRAEVKVGVNISSQTRTLES